MQAPVFFQEIVDQGDMLIWVAGLDKQCFYFNRAWLAFTGRTLEQERNSGWATGVHPDDYDACLTGFSEAFDQQQKFSLLYRLRRHDGEYRWLQDDGCPRFNEQGEFLGFIGYCLDVTSQKQAEIREHQRRQLLQSLMQGEPLDQLLHQLCRNLEALKPGIRCTLKLLGSCQELSLQSQPALRDFFQLQKEEAGHCWAEPILSSQSLPLGLLNVYCTAHLQPGEAELQLIADEARFAGLIIEKKLSETALLLANRVFQQAREAIMITDMDGRIVEVNQGFTQITGYNRDEVLGKNPRLLKSNRHDTDFYRTIWNSLKTQESWQGEIWNRNKQGDLFPSMCTISLVRNEQGQPQHYVSLFSDITLIKEHQKQLEMMAHYDALTQLPNRLLLADRLRLARANCIRRNTSLAVIFLDLDGFKAINDTYSHALGDQLLVSLTQRLSRALRESDTLARLGGDEFILVLSDLKQPDDWIKVVERLLHIAAEPLLIEGRLLSVSASLGVTLFPADQSDVEGLIRHADHAMYQAKQAGKNCYRLFNLLESRSTEAELTTQAEASSAQEEDPQA